MVVVAIISCCAIFIKPNRTTPEEDNNIPASVDWSQLTYTALGDSITYGATLEGKTDSPYPVLVAETLDLLYYYNFASGGDTLSLGGEYGSIIQQLRRIPTKSDIISIMGGTNDFAQNMTIGTINDSDLNTVYGALKHIASTLKQTHPNSFIFFMTALPMGDKKLEQFSATQYKISDINDAIKNVALMYNIPVLDTYNLAGYQNEMNNAEVTDGCHPSANFHKNNLAPLIANFIKENYSK